MTHVKLAGLALLASLALACSEEKRDASQWPISRDELERGAAGEKSAEEGGEISYRRYCVGCHATDGRGNGGTTGADFTASDSALTTRSDAELIAAVRDGKRGKTATMPPHKPVLNDAQIAAVVAYVRARFQPQPAQADDGH